MHAPGVVKVMEGPCNWFHCLQETRASEAWSAEHSIFKLWIWDSHIQRLSPVWAVEWTVNCGSLGPNSCSVQSSLIQDSCPLWRVERMADMITQPPEVDLSANMNSSLDFLVTYKHTLIFVWVLKKHKLLFLPQKHLCSGIIWSDSWFGVNQGKACCRHTVGILYYFHYIYYHHLQWHIQCFFHHRVRELNTTTAA